MTYQIRATDGYSKKLGKFLKSHPELKEAYWKTIDLLESNPFHPSLRLHGLSGQFKGLHSVSINMKYRICIDFFIEDNKIILIDVNKHYEN
jgi:mRNA-degrading endonuclease YafQ of YafQ-DinJ toxin-antitoxin module